MSDVSDTSDVTDAAETIPAAPRQGSSFRLIGLLLILTVAGVALLYDYAVARRAVKTADQTLQKLLAGDPDVKDPDGDGSITAANVHELLGMQPSEVEDIANGMIEIYRWRSSVPYRTHDLYVIYDGKELPLLHDNSAFTKPTGDQLPPKPVIIEELTQEQIDKMPSPPSLISGVSGAPSPGGASGPPPEQLVHPPAKTKEATTPTEPDAPADDFEPPMMKRAPGGTGRPKAPEKSNEGSANQ